MKEEERARVIKLVNEQLDKMDENVEGFRPTRERFEIIEPTTVPGAIVVGILKASAESVNSETSPYCLHFFGYLAELQIARFITYLPVDTLSDAEKIINHYQDRATEERAEKEKYGFPE